MVVKESEFELLLGWVRECRAPPREFQAVGWACFGAVVAFAVGLVDLGSSATLVQEVVLWIALGVSAFGCGLSLAFDQRGKLNVTDTAKRAEQLMGVIKRRTVSGTLSAPSGNAGATTSPPGALSHTEKPAAPEAELPAKSA